MRVKNIVLLLVMILFSACVDKYKVGFFKEDKTEQQALKYSVKKEIFTLSKRYLVVATYLNPIQNLDIDRGKDNFLFNVFSNPDTFKAQDSNNTNINALNSSHNLSKISPIHSKWSKYFLLTQPLSDEEVEAKIILNDTYKLNFKFKK